MKIKIASQISTTRSQISDNFTEEQQQNVKKRAKKSREKETAREKRISECTNEQTNKRKQKRTDEQTMYKQQQENNKNQVAFISTSVLIVFSFAPFDCDSVSVCSILTKANTLNAKLPRTHSYTCRHTHTHIQT